MDFINDNRMPDPEKPRGEFERVADRIAEIFERRAEEQGISPKDVPEITSPATGGEVNCYPGYPADTCYPVAYFFSLASHRYTKGCRGHLTCRQALEKLVQHMQGLCVGHTHAAIMITDSWDTNAFEDWRANIEQIRRNSLVEIYLLTAGRAARIF